jgi:transcriptional regulator with XRE-family HTH domain
MTPDEVVGNAILRLREGSGMTQRELGERLAVAGAKTAWQSGVAALERGRRRIGIDELFILAGIFDVPIQVLWVVPPRRRVLVDARVLSADEWHAALRVTDEERGMLASRPHAPRPRDRQGQAFIRMARRVTLEKREASLANRVKFPGPTFVADRKVVVPVEIAGAFGRVPLKLRPNQPWVARDRPEREALLEAEARGKVRRITRSEARQLRARAVTKGGDRRVHPS